MQSLNDVIRAGRPQGTGVEYFVENPAEFVALVEKDLNLAYRYMVRLPSEPIIFTTQEVRKMIRKAYETSYTKPFYSFFHELFALLTHKGDFFTTKEQSNKLACVIITLLNHLGTDNLLDPEFPKDYTFNALMAEGHYAVCAAILLHLSPMAATSVLQAPFNATQDAFQKMISALPSSHAAVKQAIAALKDLNTLNANAFETFIYTARDGDLLQSLKDKDANLANAFYAINSHVINNQFRDSAPGLPMDVPAVAPPPKSPPPPYHSQPTSEMLLRAFKLGDTQRLPIVTPSQNKGECRII